MAKTISRKCQKVTACMVTRLPLTVPHSLKTRLNCTSGMKWSPQFILSLALSTIQFSSSPLTLHGVSLFAWAQVSKTTHILMKRFSTWLEKVQLTGVKSAANASKLWGWKMNSANNKTTTQWCFRHFHTSISVRRIFKLTWLVYTEIVPRLLCKLCLRLMFGSTWTPMRQTEYWLTLLTSLNVLKKHTKNFMLCTRHSALSIVS